VMGRVLCVNLCYFLHVNLYYFCCHSGVAKFHKLINGVQPEVIIVEEAAEVCLEFCSTVITFCSDLEVSFYI